MSQNQQIVLNLYLINPNVTTNGAVPENQTLFHLDQNLLKFKSTKKGFSIIKKAIEEISTNETIEVNFINSKGEAVILQFELNS